MLIIFQPKIDNKDYWWCRSQRKMCMGWKTRIGSINKLKQFLAKQEEDDLSMPIEIISGSEFDWEIMVGWMIGEDAMTMRDFWRGVIEMGEAV